MEENKPISLARGTSVVAGLTLLSRILGFVRDALVAKLFGASIYADAFFVAFRIPNLLRSLVAEGALTSAFVPVFNDELKKGKDRAAQALHSIALVLSVGCFLLVLSGILFSTELILLFAPGFTAHEAQVELAASMLSIMMPIVIVVALVAMVTGALNSLGIFGLGAWAQIVMNFALIMGALVAGYFDAVRASYVLAGSVLVGAFLQLVVQLPALRRAGMLQESRKFAFNWIPVRSVARLLPPAVIGATVYQLQIFITTVMASLCGAGAVSWLFYADRVVQLPVGVYTIALSSVLLAVLSKARAEEDSERFSQELNKALSFTVFLLFPVTAGLYFHSEPLVKLVFERGEFGSNDVLQTSAVVSIAALSLLPVSFHSIFARVFIAHKDTVTTTLVGCITLVLTVFFSLSFIGTIAPSAGVTAIFLKGLQQYVPHYADLSVVGLTLASLLASCVACLLLGALLTLRFQISFLYLFPALCRNGAATLAFAVCSVLARNELMHRVSPILASIMGVFIGSIAWFVVLRAAKSEELQKLISIVKSKT